MRQNISFNDKRNLSKDGQNRQNIRLEIPASGQPGDCAAFMVNITDTPKGLTPGTVTVTLEKEAGKPEIYTFPRESAGEHKADWFGHIETVASNAPMEYSEERFSVCDTLADITADLAAMMGDRTLLGLVSAPGSTGGSGTGKKVPEHALQIINAEPNKVLKI